MDEPADSFKEKGSPVKSRKMNCQIRSWPHGRASGPKPEMGPSIRAPSTKVVKFKL
jgi:hypothetical protein